MDDVVPATGHSFGEWTESKAPTCTEDGEETRKCEHCDATETQAVAATGHSYVDKVTPPTATEKGYTTHTCEDCGHSYVDSYVDPDPNASADTGDAFSGIWIALLVISLFGAAALVVTRKKFFVK